MCAADLYVTLIKNNTPSSSSTLITYLNSCFELLAKAPIKNQVTFMSTFWSRDQIANHIEEMNTRTHIDKSIVNFLALPLVGVSLFRI